MDRNPTRKSLSTARAAMDDHGRLLRYLVKWLILGSAVGVLAGSTAAVFLWGLAIVTDTQQQTDWLLYLLPLAGLAIGVAYHYLGGRSVRGNNVILSEIHELAVSTQPSNGARRWVPRRMAIMVLVGTWVTHLFGGSAGREGTAIQMSGSLADGLSRLLRLSDRDRRVVLITAVSGGFGSVFSVPLAGAVFGLEVQSVGRMRYDALVPALTASVVGNLTFHAIGLAHDVTPHYPVTGVSLSAVIALKVAAAALAFGLVSVLFIEVTRGISAALRRIATWPPLRPVIGGVVVIGLVELIGSRAYLGLSFGLIETALTGASLAWYAFAAKLLLTAVTLGSGFQGGEVTPLFVIGATLGAALAGPLGLPPELLAAVGFVAVFAAATNTPLACTIMAVELFGPEALPYFAIGCVVAYVFSSHRGIYDEQRLDTPKDGSDPNPGPLPPLRPQ